MRNAGSKISLVFVIPERVYATYIFCTLHLKKENADQVQIPNNTIKKAGDSSKVEGRTETDGKHR